METQIIPASKDSLLLHQPSIFKIENNSSDLIKNIFIGNSYENRSAINLGLQSSISVSGLVTGVSYILFLASTEDEPFICGKTRIKFVNTPFDNPFLITVTRKDRRGNRSDQWIKFKVREDQEQKDMAESTDEYLFNGGTGIRPTKF